MKICPVGVEFFHAEGRTEEKRAEMAKLIFAFRNFALAPVKRK